MTTTRSLTKREFDATCACKTPYADDFNLLFNRRSRDVMKPVRHIGTEWDAEQRISIQDVITWWEEGLIDDYDMAWVLEMLTFFYNPELDAWTEANMMYDFEDRAILAPAADRFLPYSDRGQELWLQAGIKRAVDIIREDLEL